MPISSLSMRVSLCLRRSGLTRSCLSTCKTKLVNSTSLTYQRSSPLPPHRIALPTTISSLLGRIPTGLNRPSSMWCTYSKFAKIVKGTTTDHGHVPTDPTLPRRTSPEQRSRKLSASTEIIRSPSLYESCSVNRPRGDPV